MSGDNEVSRDAATIYDVARVAGVSTATVSRALNEPGRVARDTRERVLAVAERLNYRPSALAQGLSHGYSRTVGVLLEPEPDGNPYYQALIEAIGRRAGSLGYEMAVTFLHPDDPSNLAEAIAVMEARRPAGYLAYAADAAYQQYERIRGEMGAPIVWLGPTPGDAGPSVCPDEELGAYLATRHLLQLGHRRTAFACVDRSEPKPGRREHGYCEALREAGEAPLLLDTQGCGPDHGRETALRLLDERPDVTAILVRNDHTAFGVVSALRERGARIPEDVSVVGFDDIPLARYCCPPLTTVDMRPADTAKRALGLLLELARGGARRGTGPDLVAPRLVVRASSGPAPGAKTPPKRARRGPERSAVCASAPTRAGRA